MLVFVVVCWFRGCVISRVVVDGDSMNPSFSDGDVLWARAFDIDELSRYQVVVADIDGKLVIKRVIALPGETLQIIDGFVYVDGAKLNDEYGYQTTLYGCAEREIILGDDEYFLMGDNRDNSRDSREWGAVNIENIEGVVVFRFFPFWKIGAAG